VAGCKGLVIARPLWILPNHWGSRDGQKNLPDGRVEVAATGPSAAIADLIAWLHHGPALAKVTNVQVEDVEKEDFPDFKVL
jgi:hydrogenase maturation factor HypF (carbamoyltransferase family)